LQLGLSTYSFPWAVGVPGFLPAAPLKPADLLHYAMQHEIHHVQFGDNLPLHLLSEGEREGLKQLADSSRINIEVGTRRLTGEQIKSYLSIARYFGSSFLRVVIDDGDYHPSESVVIEEINTLLPYLQAANVVLAIENHDRFPANVLKRIIQSTDENWVGICLDTANSIGAGEGINEVLSVLAPYTVNLHIKDITIKRFSHKMGFSVDGCAAGEGILNIPEIIGALKKQNRCKTATLEVWSGPEKNIEDTLQKEKAWVDNSINYLKKIVT
jgi:sugar phosphate isomerase/epimerase